MTPRDNIEILCECERCHHKNDSLVRHIEYLEQEIEKWKCSASMWKDYFGKEVKLNTRTFLQKIFGVGL